MSESSEILLAEEVELIPAPANVATEPISPTQSSAARPLSDLGRKQRFLWLGILGLIYGVSVAVPRSNLPHVPLCWFNASTGLSCPTCGMTRAFTEIGHGNFTAAMQLNVMALPIFLLGLVLASIMAWEIRARHSVLVPWMSKHRRAICLAALACVAVRYLPLVWDF